MCRNCRWNVICMAANTVSGLTYFVPVNAEEGQLTVKGITYLNNHNVI